MTSHSKPLTSLTLNALKPGETITDGGEYRGLRATCGKSGVKTFVYRYRSPVDQKIKQIKIGRFLKGSLKGADEEAGLVTLADARVKFLELKALRDNGVCLVEKARQEKTESAQQKIQTEKEKTLNQFTVEKLCANYVADCIEGVRSKKAAAECRRSIYGDPVKKLGNRPASDISSKDIFTLIMGIVDRGANVHAGFILRELTAAYDHAIDCELPDDHVNPCYQAKGRLKRKRLRLTCKPGTRVLNDGEMAALLKWLPDSKFTPGQRDVLSFTLMTGCRTGEVCAVRWDDVELDAGVWHLKETKTGVPRDVQLSRQACEFLKQRTGENYIFPQLTGNHVSQKTISERMWVMRGRGVMLDIEHWTPHDLRRSVRTGLARMGCPSEVAEAILGHSPKGIEGVYNLHRYEREAKEWLQRWCDHLDTLTASTNVVSLGVRHG